MRARFRFGRGFCSCDRRALIARQRSGASVEVSLPPAASQDGTWADPTMHLVVLPAADDAEATLHGLEDTADHAWEHCSDNRTTDGPAVEPGEVITPDKHLCYNLHFDGDVWQSLYKVGLRVRVRVRVRG